jgi:anaerobic magnesium-protoporphyrin IX monomethyl ester cyclase
MKPKIALVNVCYPYPVVVEGAFTGINKIWQPVELGYICANLRKIGNTVKLLDSNALRIAPDETHKHVDEFDMVFVSSTAYDRWECPHLDIKPALDTVKAIKDKSPKKPVFLIGGHVSSRPKEMIELSGCDAAVVGEPEDTVIDIISSDDWKNAKGVAYLKDGELVHAPRDMAVDISSLPTPDYSDLPMDKYFFDMLGDRYAVIETSRGCPFQCSYCFKKMFGQYRKKPIEKVKSEIMDLIRKYHVKRINFLDLEFTVNRPLVEELCRWMIDEGFNIEWSCQTRLDSVDEKILHSMKKAGCKLIMYGVESGSQRIIDQIGKNIRIEDFKEGITATKKAGIESVCFFMFGFPQETDEEREMTIQLALELDPDYASFFLARPYPGTRLFESVSGDAVGLFPQAIGGDEEVMKLKKVCDSAFRRFYYRPKVLWKRLIRGGYKILFYQMKILVYKAGLIRGA